MAIKITDDCINCGACEPECPNKAIYEGGQEWSYADGTILSGSIKLSSGEAVDADNMNEAKSSEFFFIISDKCTECVGFHDTPQCQSVCPVECCLPDDAHTETKEQLEAKKMLLHGN